MCRLQGWLSGGTKPKRRDDSDDAPWHSGFSSRALGLETQWSSHNLAGSHFLSMEPSPFGGSGERGQSHNLAGFEELGKFQDSRDLLQGYVSSNRSWREKALSRKLPGVRLSRVIPHAGVGFS